MTNNTFCFSTSSPTAILLGRELKKNNWKPSLNGCLNDAIFDIPDELSNTLEFKHCLAEFLQKKDLNLAPQTFYIDDDNYPQVIDKLSEGVWILKPSMLNNGQHIKLFYNKADIYRHYQLSNRMGGPHVIQAYIHPPHLLKGPQAGHKYSIRMFVVMIFPYAVFLYPHGYFNISLTPYDISQQQTLLGHLTNEHLTHDTRNVIQIPSYQYEIFLNFFPKIQALLRDFFSQYASIVDKNIQQKIAFLGVDFMLDANENLFLLEMNHGPCFPTDDSHPLQEKLYQGFWQACVQEMIPKILNPWDNNLKLFHQLC